MQCSLGFYFKDVQERIIFDFWGNAASIIKNMDQLAVFTWPPPLTFHTTCRHQRTGTTGLRNSHDCKFQELVSGFITFSFMLCVYLFLFLYFVYFPYVLRITTIWISFLSSFFLNLGAGSQQLRSYFWLCTQGSFLAVFENHMRC